MIEEKKLFKVSTSNDVVHVTADDIPDAIKAAIEAARRYPARFSRTISSETITSVELENNIYAG